MSNSKQSPPSLPSWKGVFLHESERDELVELVPDAGKQSGWAHTQALRDRAILSLFVLSGLRSNELRMLDRRDIDFRDRRVHVLHGKGGKQRKVPLHPVAAAALKAYFAERGDPDPAAFLSQRMTRISNRALGHMLDRYLADLDVDKRVTLHALRRTFATAVYRKTHDPVLVQRLLGHARLDTTMLYIGLVDDDLADAVNLL